MTGQYSPPGSSSGGSNLWLVKDLVIDNWKPGKSYSSNGVFYSFEPEAVDGYEIAGIVGYIAENASSSGKRSSYCMQYSRFYDPTDGMIKISYRDTGSDSGAKIKLTFKVLYFKGSILRPQS